MLRDDCGERLEFDNDLTEADEVCAISLLERLAFVGQRQWAVGDERDTAGAEFKR